jgi:parallel beta-helix repeat protein
LISQKHGHGILEISNCKNIKIEGGKFSGRGDFLDKNYEDSDGGGEKISTLRKKVNWGHYRNSELKTLGAYNDGFIGNSGIGILVYNGSEDILITNVEVEKFNYSGIQVQFLGHPAEIQENYCKNVTIEDNVIHDIYSAGISVHGLSASKILNNTIYDIGHPDTNGQELQVNPGYGITMRGVLREGGHADNITVAYNGIRNCKRVGIDSHSGNNLNFHDNTIDRAYIAGISIVGKSGKRDNVTLSKNIINNCGNVSGGEGIEAKTGIRNIYPNTIIEKNIIKNSGYGFGIYSRGSNTTIKENTILYYHNTNNLYTRGICVMGSEDRYVIGNEILDNTIQGDIATSIYINYLNESSVMNNISKENNSSDPFTIKNSRVKNRRNKSL